MAYTPTTWVEGVTTLGPTNMNKIEAALASLSAPAPSATPPASPADGDLWYLPNANGRMWQFRYNTGSASANKWEFIGGSDLVGDVNTVEATSSTVNTDLATVQSLTIPRSGDYSLRLSANYTQSAGTGGLASQMVLVRNATPVAEVNFAQSLNWWISGAFEIGVSLTASDVMKAQYRVSAGCTASWGARSLHCIPIRVA